MRDRVATRFFFAQKLLPDVGISCFLDLYLSKTPWFCLLAGREFKENEDNFLQREIPARQSRRRFRKINYRGERQTITDDVDVNSYLAVQNNLLAFFLSVASITELIQT